MVHVSTDQVVSISMPPLMVGHGSTFGIGGLPDFNDEIKGARNAKEFLDGPQGKILAQHIKNELNEKHRINPKDVTEQELIGIVQAEQINQKGQKPGGQDTTWDYITKAVAASVPTVVAPAATAAAAAPHKVNDHDRNRTLLTAGADKIDTILGYK